MKISIMMVSALTLILAASCAPQGKANGPYLSYALPASSGEDICDGPCEPVVVDSCRLMYSSDTAVVGRVVEDPRQEDYSSCDHDDPPYSDTLYRLKIAVDWAAVASNQTTSSPMDVILMARWFDDIPQTGDTILIGLREDQGEWFAPAFLYVGFHNDSDTAGFQTESDGEVVIDLPSGRDELIAAMTNARTNFETTCSDRWPTRLDDATFNQMVRKRPICGAPDADEESGLMNDDTTDDDI